MGPAGAAMHSHNLYAGLWVSQTTLGQVLLNARAEHADDLKNRPYLSVFTARVELLGQRLGILAGAVGANRVLAEPNYRPQLYLRT